MKPWTCKEHGRKFCWACAGFTVGFPIEHLLWERTPLRFLTALLGL